MFDTETILQSVNFLMVFTEGLLSFFSPCVLPLLPLYIGYLSGSSTSDEDGKQSNSRVFIFTVCFILGIFIALFLMNISLSVLASFFRKYQMVFTMIGGVLILILGIHQLGLFKLPGLQRNLGIKFNPNGKPMTAGVAFAMGFTFSFAWTPCIGPALSSILILASNSESLLMSNLLVLTYALGLTIPFLLAGLFTNQILRFFAKFKRFMEIAVKVGAVILIVMGVMMISGQMKTMNAALTPDYSQSGTGTQNDSEQEVVDENLAPDFELTDLDGETLRLSDYRGKVVFMNFWGTWCPACKTELPYIQELSEKYADSDEVAVVTIIGRDERETDEDGVREFMEVNGFTFRTAMDPDGMIGYVYGINAFPTTFLINKDGTVYGYVPGAMDITLMEQVIEMAINQEPVQ